MSHLLLHSILERGSCGRAPFSAAIVTPFGVSLGSSRVRPRHAGPLVQPYGQIDMVGEPKRAVNRGQTAVSRFPALIAAIVVADQSLSIIPARPAILHDVASQMPADASQAGRSGVASC